MTWIGSHRNAYLGYPVALEASNHKNRIGWVLFDRPEDDWVAICSAMFCQTVVREYTKTGAAEILREHHLLAHR